MSSAICPILFLFIKLSSYWYYLLSIYEFQEREPTLDTWPPIFLILLLAVTSQSYNTNKINNTIWLGQKRKICVRDYALLFSQGTSWATRIKRFRSPAVKLVAQLWRNQFISMFVYFFLYESFSKQTGIKFNLDNFKLFLRLKRMTMW
jgi:hypothetical protein